MNMNFLHDRRKEYEEHTDNIDRIEAASFIDLPGWPVKPKSKKEIVLVCIVLLSFLGLAGYLSYGFWSAKGSLGIYNNEFSQTQNENKEIGDIIAEVSKLIILPNDEKPTIATVSDPKVLKDQPFFSKAKVGDKVLIYTKAQKAILYDPVANKIVNIAPINLGNQP